MAKSLEAKLSNLPEERRNRILLEGERLHHEYLTLQELRKVKEKTQVQLAESLNVKQATIAQMEKRGDMLLSTVRSYVEAMGGTLDLVVQFPGQEPVHLTGLGDTEESKHRSQMVR